MATRKKAATKQVKAPVKAKKATAKKATAKKATAKKSPARILLPSGATDEGDKKGSAKKSPTRRPKTGR